MQAGKILPTCAPVSVKQSERQTAGPSWPSFCALSCLHPVRTIGHVGKPVLHAGCCQRWRCSGCGVAIVEPLIYPRIVWLFNTDWMTLSCHVLGPSDYCQNARANKFTA